MASINAYLSKDAQLRVAHACVRKHLPIPKKMYMGKECDDIGAELACASILLPVIGDLPARVRDDLPELIGNALESGSSLIKIEEHDEIRLRGFAIALAITNIAAMYLKG